MKHYVHFFVIILQVMVWQPLYGGSVYTITQADITSRGLLLISVPGTYEFAENIYFGEKPIFINCSDVVLNLAGYSIIFSAQNPYGIRISPECEHITIKNGLIKSDSPEPFFLINVKNVTYENISFCLNSITGIVVSHSAGVTLKGIKMSGKLELGIQVGNSYATEISSCSIKNINARKFCAIKIFSSENISCLRNTISENFARKRIRGILVKDSSRIVIAQNVFSMNTGEKCSGISLLSGSYNKISDNKIFMNATKNLHVLAENNFATTFIGINVGETEQETSLLRNEIRDNAGDYAAYGIYVRRGILHERHIYLEKNNISSNNGKILQFGIYDGDNLSVNAYLGNVVSFHGQSLDGSSMPLLPQKKANYYIRKNLPIANMIKETCVDELSLGFEEHSAKNISIY